MVVPTAMHPLRIATRGSATLLVFFLFVPISARAAAFSDVPPDHPASAAIEFLRERGYAGGYRDGTFRPDQLVTRAEAVKLVTAPVAPIEELATFIGTAYRDIAPGDWYLPYVEYARQRLGIIDGPPKKAVFRGADPVLEVEFLKMFLLAQKVDPLAYGEVDGALAPDAPGGAWHHPYLRLALSSAMIAADDKGYLSPGKQLTRGDVALRMEHFFRYRDGAMTQNLLTGTEREILRLLEYLGRNDVTGAEYASVRALILARGAHTSAPSTALVRGALKITEAFHALVQAYQAGLRQDFDAVVTFAGAAWRLSDEASAATAEMQAIVDQLHANAQAMAERARGLKRQKTQQ